MRKTLRALLASLGVALTFTVTPTAGATIAPVGASDTATPNYLSSTSPSTGTNVFSCTGGGCTMTITTKTSPFPCTSELIVLSGATTPGLLYQGTFCAVSITGWFEDPLEQDSPVCTLEAVQTLGVTFSSGANSAFNGSFSATGTFKPTGVNATTHYITSALITVKAGSQLQGNPAATGTVKATFQVQFGGAGLSPYCNAAPVGLTTVTSGTVIVRF